MQIYDTAATCYKEVYSHDQINMTEFYEYDQIYDIVKHYPLRMTKNYDNDKPSPLIMTKFEND